MYIEKLKLTNFRSYDELELELSKNINVFVGNNAEGKTNILESIYLSCITKSYRTVKDIECIKFDKDFFRINHKFVDENKNIEVDVYLDKSNKKQIKENEIKIKKYSDFIGTIPIVIFSPDNMDIVKGSPKNRRKFLDILISQLSKKYVVYLQEYNKLLSIKNNLLKMNKENIDFTYLDIIDENLAEKIEYIISNRKNYVDSVEKEAQKIQQELSNNTEEIKLKYISDFFNKNKEEILNILKQTRETDIFKKTSTKGIGHDDILVLVNEKEVSKYGSQGQNRTALLSMKLAEFEILKNEKEKTPIILLDDVFSELDINRINYLIEYISNYQVFITTTEIESIDNIENKTIFKVQKGTVEKIKI